MKHKSDQNLIFSSYSGKIHSQFNKPSITHILSECCLPNPDFKYEILHEGRNRLFSVLVHLPEEENVEIVIKEFNPKGFKKLKTLFLPSGPQKAWSGAIALHNANINTPAPVAYFVKKKNGFIKNGFFAAERILDIKEIRFIFMQWTEEKIKPLLIQLAEFLRNCHESGILHRDLSDGNILVREEGKKKFSFFLVDTNRIKIKKKISGFQAVKNLIRLGIPDSLQEYFLEEVLQQKPVKPLYKFWYNMNKKSFSNYIQLKKKLKLKKIAEKLKLQ